MIAGIPLAECIPDVRAETDIADFSHQHRSHTWIQAGTLTSLLRIAHPVPAHNL